MKKINFILILVAIIGSGYMAVSHKGDIVLLLKDLSILITITLPYIIQKLFKKSISNVLAFVYILFIFSAHFLGVIMEFYNSVAYFDKFNHFMSGVLIAVLALPIINMMGIYNKNKKFVNIVLMIAFGFMTAGLWELFEYGASVAFGVDPQLVAKTGVNDTMLDIIVAFMGTLIVGIWYKITNNERLVDNLANGVK